MHDRKEVVEKLALGVEEHSWARCPELCFKAIYNLPADLQINLARFAIGRYLPIFETKWPHTTWPSQLVSNIAQWAERFGRRTPDEPDVNNPADAAFLFSIDALLLANCYRTIQLTLTSSCVAAVVEAIHARMDNVWIADDPEAVEIWIRIGAMTESGQSEGTYPLLESLVERSAEKNTASIAVRVREWSKIVEWLELKEMGSYPYAADAITLEQSLTVWKNNEMLPVLPSPEDNNLERTDV